MFARENFLDHETCARLRAQAAAASFNLGAVSHVFGSEEVKPEVRSVRCAEVGAETLCFLEERINAIQADLERHFGQRR